MKKLAFIAATAMSLSSFVSAEVTTEVGSYTGTKTGRIDLKVDIPKRISLEQFPTAPLTITDSGDSQYMITEVEFRVGRNGKSGSPMPYTITIEGSRGNVNRGFVLEHTGDTDGKDKALLDMQVLFKPEGGQMVTLRPGDLMEDKLMTTKALGSTSGTAEKLVFKVPKNGERGTLKAREGVYEGFVTLTVGAK